jgi:hypothetical protein
MQRFCTALKMLSDEAAATLVDEATRLVVGYLQ